MQGKRKVQHDGIVNITLSTMRLAIWRLASAVGALAVRSQGNGVIKGPLLLYRTSHLIHAISSSDLSPGSGVEEFLSGSLTFH